MSFDPAQALSLAADCSRCRALCCVGPGFTASADFAHTKPAGTPCHHLGPDARCTIHVELRARGYGGCTAYDCFGAGQRAVALLDAATGPAGAPQHDLLAAFAVLRPLHEMLLHLSELTTLDDDPRLSQSLDRVLALATPAPDVAAHALADLDMDAVHAEVAPLLREASRRIRASSGWPVRERIGADLAGADLLGADLRATCLRGASLLGADLRAADLRRADLIGADLRGADLCGADLSTSLCLTRSQVGSARGDRTTLLPARLRRPEHWT